MLCRKDDREREERKEKGEAHSMRPFLSVWSKMSVRVAPVTLFSRASTRGYTLSFTYRQKAMMSVSCVVPSACILNVC